MKVLTKESSTGARKKESKPTTLNPGTNNEASQKHNPFTTRENAPKLRMFIGRDSTEITGLTAALTTPMLAPAIKAAGKLAKFTPGKIMSTTKRLRAVAKMVKSEPNMID